MQRNQRSNCQHPLDHGKSKGIPENIHFCFTDYTKAFDCVDHSKMWKILEEMRIPDHPTCFLRNLYAAQEATVRTEHNQQQTDSKLGKVSRIYIVTLCILIISRVHHVKCWAG